MRSRSLVVVGLVCSVLLTGAEVTYYEEAPPQSLNPLFVGDMSGIRSTELTHDRLTYRSAITYELKSKLVNLESMQKLGDGKSVKLRVKEGIRWHDGQSFGPEDICFTIDAMKNPQTAAVPRIRDIADGIVSCEVIKKEKSVVITFPKAYHNPGDRLSFAILPKHAFDSTAIMPDTDYAVRPIGTGAAKASRGSKVTSFTNFPNAHHNVGVPLMKQLVMGDPYAAVQTLIMGSAHGMVVVPPPHRPAISASDEMALKSYDLRSWWFVALNTNKGALRDKGIRQAVNLSIDRSDLRQLTVGVASEDPNPPCEFISGPFVGSSPYYNRAIKAVAKSDLAQASKLMEAAGAEQHFGRWTLDGKPITFKIGMNASLGSEAIDLLNQIGNQLNAAGFDRVVYRISEDDWNRRAITGQLEDYDMLIGKWSFGVVEDVGPIFHTKTAGKGALNVFKYSNREVDGLIETFDAATTDTEAQDAYHQLHATVADDLPYLYLWKLDTKSAWRNEVRSNMITPYYYFTEYDKWRFDG